MYPDEGKLKSMAYDQATTGQAVMGISGQDTASYRPPTMREQSEKSVGYHRQEADKHDMAAAFFRENPAFDEFIRLIRSGAIQF